MSDNAWGRPHAAAGLRMVDAVRRGARASSARIALNAAGARAFLRSRSRDLRFRVIPYDICFIANALAAFLTALGLFTLVLDPHLKDWQGSMPASLMPMFGFFNEIGKCEWTLIGCALVVLFSLLRDLRDECPRKGRHHWLRVATAAYVFTSVALAGIIAALLKYAIGRARPSQFAEVGSLSFDFLSLDASWASFPSGHTTSIMAFAFAVALLVPRLRIFLLAAGFWVGFARLATGAHYPSDVLAGCALGALVAWLLARKLAQHRIVFRFDEKGALVPARLGKSFGGNFLAAPKPR